MQLHRDCYSEWLFRGDSSRHTVLVSLMACAVGGTASAAVILSLLNFSIAPLGVPPVPPVAITDNASAPQDTRIVAKALLLERPMRPAATSVVYPSDQSVAQNSPVIEPPPVALVSSSDEPVTRAKAEHPSAGHSQRLSKHRRVHYWRQRFTHTAVPSRRFSFW
jgi:hypothetical protein